MTWWCVCCPAEANGVLPPAQGRLARNMFSDLPLFRRQPCEAGHEKAAWLDLSGGIPKVGVPFWGSL